MGTSSCGCKSNVWEYVGGGRRIRKWERQPSDVSIGIWALPGAITN